MSKSITILIADDHQIVRTGLANVIDYEDGLTVVAVANDGQSALRLAAKHHPDVVIMDLVMPVMGGIEALEKMPDVSPQTRVLILTSYGSPEELIRAHQAGAAGILMKSATNREIIQAVRRIAGGGTVCPPDIARMLSTHRPKDDLSERQREILEFVARGFSNQDIADRFGITVPGVKKHMTAIFNRLGVANRAEAATYALRQQLQKI